MHLHIYIDKYKLLHGQQGWATGIPISAIHLKHNHIYEVINNGEGLKAHLTCLYIYNLYGEVPKNNNLKFF